jgi:hypothetical protein
MSLNGNFGKQHANNANDLSESFEYTAALYQQVIHIPKPQWYNTSLSKAHSRCRLTLRYCHLVSFAFKLSTPCRLVLPFRTDIIDTLTARLNQENRHTDYATRFLRLPHPRTG